MIFKKFIQINNIIYNQQYQKFIVLELYNITNTKHNIIKPKTTVLNLSITILPTDSLLSQTRVFLTHSTPNMPLLQPLLFKFIFDGLGYEQLYLMQRKYIWKFFYNIELNLKMSKELKQELSDSVARKKTVKSTDLKRRLFQIGVNNSPKTNMPSQLFPQANSPKNALLNKGLLALSPKQKYSQTLIFKPSQPSQLMKTSTKDFHIRKTPKSPFSSSGTHKKATTMSAFYKPDTVRGEVQQIKEALLEARQKLEQEDHNRQIQQHNQSRLDEYVRLILRGVQKIDEFMYLVRGIEENIYQLELVDFEVVRNHEGQPDFQYYTVSRKGFCQYVGGKPQNFIDIAQWAQEKSLYCNIKALKFFFRFRRWKTLQMWRRTVTRQRRETIAHSLQQKMFLLEPSTRKTLIQLRKLTIQMEKSILIIARNQGTYTLESFKHCQERARRQASLAVQQFSRQSRAVVRKCFENKLSQLRQNIKKNSNEQKLPSNNPTGAQSPKQGAFQALGFPSKMTYEHRSRLRKQAGRFLRFSYLVDSLHLSCLAGIYSSQVQTFVSHLQEVQFNQPVRLRATIEEGKDEINNEKMFSLQLLCNFKEVPFRLITEGDESQEFLPSKIIRLKDQQPGKALWVYRICQHWLSMQPNLDQVLDELTFLLRQGLISLKCFQRWAKHREMQKYVSVLQQWDDLVSENWQISQNDNLDPLLLLDSLDPILTRLKAILKTTQNKITDTIRNILTSLLNAYWEYSKLDLNKLQNSSLVNPAETFQRFLGHTNKLLERVTNQLPHRLEMGVFTLHVTRIKNILGQKFAGILQNLKLRLPELVEQRTAVLNQWLTAFGSRLREEILNIDDYVKLVGVIKKTDIQFSQRRDQCNELAQLYQTMQFFKMDTRKRKDFETVTLKLKDQLDQLLIAAQQNIQRKADLYTRQVLRYHIPALLKDIAKALEVAEQPKFLKLEMSKSFVLTDLRSLQNREKELIEQRKKCDLYMQALKIQGQKIEALDQLSKQISDRVRLWETLEEWQNFVKQTQEESVKNLPISQLVQKVKYYRQITKQLDASLPPNEVLSYLKQKVQEYHIYLPLLQGFSQSLSQSHWNEIYEILPQKFPLDLKKRDFKLREFLSSNVGLNAKQIQSIFEKSRIQAKLQNQYQQLQDGWLNLIAKIKTEGRFNIICNQQSLRQDLNKILMSFTQTLADPHAQSLRQYTITYQGLISTQKALEQWIRVQKKILQIQKLCRLLDIKKLADYNYFQNAERIYKQMTKATAVKGAQMGVRVGKLLVSVTEDKIAQIDQNLTKVYDNIKSILFEHRKLFPAFYLFEDSQLLKLITEPTHQLIEEATKKLLPGVKKLEIQNQRITTVITIDGDRFFKNPISTNSQIQQILFQVSQTIAEIHKRTMRTCRYKAIQNNLSSLVQIHNIQHLLAVNRVDFSQYTTISIQNQQESPDSLMQFRKVMRKDTAQDIKNRQTMKESQSESKQPNIILMYKYDTLLLQQLVYEEILDQLIRSNIQRPQEFIWASQLKFYWEDTAADQQNITIRQLHLNLKYGNDFLGSNTKVIIQSEPELLLGLKLAEPVVFTGNSYALERLFNAMGYKMLHYNCSPSVTQFSLRNFLIGCYFSDYLPVLNLAGTLPLALKNAISNHSWVNQFKASSVKKNSAFIRQIQHPYTLFATLRNNTSAYNFGSSFRVINYNPPKTEFLKGGMQLLGIFEQQKTNILLRIFSSIRFVQQRSDMQGVSLQKFLNQSLLQEISSDENRLFPRLLTHLKSKISIQTYQALQKHLQSLGLVSVSTEKLFTNNKLNNLIKYLWQRKIVIFGGQGRSKKHFLKNQLSKLGVDLIEVFGQSLAHEDKQLKKYFLSLTKQSQKKDKCVLYIEYLTPRLLLTLEKLIYFDDFFTLTQLNLAIVLDIPVIDKFADPHSISSFLVFNYQSPKEFISSILNQWTVKNFQEERQRQVTKILQEIVLPSLQNLNSKDERILQQKIIKFLKHMQSLFPIKNVLEAAIYTLGILYRGCEQQELKLEYLTKKHMGDDYFGQGNHISNLIYSKHTQKEGMVTQAIFFQNWMIQNSFKDKDYIITSEIIHLLTACRRIHDKTESAIILQGKGNSGKTTCLQIYRQLYHENSFYLSISAKETKNWNRKINLTLQKHGINLLGARINYKQTVIMIEDLNLAQKRQLLPLQLMTHYKKIETEGGIMKLKNVKYLFTSKNVPQVLQKESLRLKILSGFGEIKSIFVSLLKQNCDSQWDIQPQFLEKVVNVSYDLCRKVNHETELQMKEGFTCLKRIIGGFARLKIRQMNNPQKELQKFWAFALLQSLKSYNYNQNILQNQLSRLELSAYNPSPLGYTHLNSKPTDKKVQSLRDPKRLYNALNQRIEKYNESDSKRYGDSFEFINFDCILQKIISISHSILLSKDHMLVGRDGSGKEALVKLAAFLNGIHFRQINGSIKTSIMQILDTTSPTPYLLLKKINTIQDQNWLQQYCYCDFESQILGQNEGKLRIFTRQKQKSLLATKSTKSNLMTNETYTMPKAKMNWQQVTAFRQSFRLVVTMTRRDQIMKISKDVRRNFHFDLMDEVPVASILQYNQKLLAADGVTSCKQALQLLSQIYEYSRDQLGISLRSNDDCIRLFSSFLTNLISEMTMQAQKFGKVLQLLQKLRTCCTMINESLCEAHSKLKQLSYLGESSKQSKAEIEAQLRQKSTALSVGEKLLEILSWLQPFYNQRYNAIQVHLQNRNQLELTFATTASYFIYLSNVQYFKRRQIFDSWTKNIPLMNTFPTIKSFLPLFLLYEQQFNTQPIDDLPQFYQNMAIIFHSAKPIAIEDDCNRGRQWLVKNCQFSYLRQDQKEFNQLLCDLLVKGNNIIIEVTSQETMNKLTETTVGILLFLPEAANNINIRGQEIEIHQEAKVYMLVGKGIKIPKNLIPQFTIVKYEQNQKLAEIALTHQFLSYTQRQSQITCLELQKKIRSLRYECENSISVVAQSIYQQLCGTQSSPNQTVLIQQLTKMTDKLMVRAQNQFTRIKQKQDLSRDFKQKYDAAASKLVLGPAQQFYKFSNKISKILRFISQKSNQKYSVPSYSQFFQTLKTALSKGIVNNIPSLILFTIRQWGPLYSKQDYLVFNLLLVMAYQGIEVEQLNTILTPQVIKTGALLSLIKRQPQPILSEQLIEEQVTQALIDIYRQQDFKSVASFTPFKDNLLQPIFWIEKDSSFEPQQKIVRIVCQGVQLYIKQKLMSSNQKIIEPTPQQSLQSLLKKNTSQQVMVLAYSRVQALEYHKILKHWNIIQNSIIFIHDPNHFQSNIQEALWQINLDNPQNIFKKIVSTYIDIMQIYQPQSNKICEQIPQQIPSISNRVSIHSSHQNQQNLELLCDKFYYFIELFVNFIKKQIQNAGLPLPLFRKQELLLLRKSIENNDNSLILAEKVECVLKYISSLINVEISQIQTLLKNTYGRILKVAQKSEEEQFYTQTQSILAQGKDFKQDLQSQEIKLINIELGWLARTRKLLGLTNSELVDRYIKQIQTYLDSYKYCRETPQVSRGSKRQINIKNRRESVVRKGRESMSLNKKLEKKVINISKFQPNQLACIHLLKESQLYQRILHQINLDLQQSRQQLQNFTYLPNQSVIRIILKILQNQGVPGWKNLFAKIGCANTPLALTLRQIVARRNQIYTYYHKFSITDTFQLDFKYLQYPLQFLKVYFATQLTSRDVFLVSSVLTTEQAERGEYLRVGGLWGCGWKMNLEGMLQHVGDNKMIQISSCFLIKKQVPSLGFCPIEVYISPENTNSVMKVYCVSKKLQTGYKLYLRSDN